MDLQQFIKETIQGIVGAAADLQEELESKGAIINPPVSKNSETLYSHEDPSHVSRRIIVIDFDVAVTAGNESSGGGKAGLKVLSFEAGGEGKHSRTSEQISRVKFSLPVVLQPAAVEARNKAERERNRDKMNRSIREGRPDDWMNR